MHAQVGHQIRLKPCGFSQGTLDIREANDRRDENTTLRQRQMKLMLPVGAKSMLPGGDWRLAATHGHSLTVPLNVQLLHATPQT